MIRIPKRDLQKPEAKPSAQSAILATEVAAIRDQLAKTDPKLLDIMVKLQQQLSAALAQIKTLEARVADLYSEEWETTVVERNSLGELLRCKHVRVR